MAITIQKSSKIVVTKSGKNLHIYAPNYSMTLIPFKIREGMGWAKGGEIIYETEKDFTGTVDELLDMILASDSYKQHHESYLQRKAEREGERERIKQLASNYNKENTQEVYEAVKYNAKNNFGWKACDILIEGNALTKLIVQNIGSFTATPYDNGQILMKGEKGKLKLFRFVNTIEDRNYHRLLSEIIE